VKKVIEIARLHPELSPRLLAVKITDEGEFSISESTVYRILKGNGLIYPRPLMEMPAQKQWRHKTTRADELWQCDATNLFVVGWGYYKLIVVGRRFLPKDYRPRCEARRERLFLIRYPGDGAGECQKGRTFNRRRFYAEALLR
jgi:hypothetical protein